MQNHERIRDLQRAHAAADAAAPSRRATHEAWLADDTVDAWRHLRMYETLRPLEAFGRGGRWLTVGDGRYGLDAQRLRRLFGWDALPTSLDPELLAEAQRRGLVAAYGVEDAERLSFADGAFDFAFCKESFHHFPRPMVALYEMLRVARQAVVLIEPSTPQALVHPAALAADLLRGRRRPRGPFRMPGARYEASGNFVYSLSRAELFKAAHAIGLKGFAWKGLNDAFVEGCQFEKPEAGNPVFRKIRRRIRLADAKVRLLPLLYDWGLITAVLFKGDVDFSLRRKMEAAGYRFEEIAPNPHL